MADGGAGPAGPAAGPVAGCDCGSGPDQGLGT